MLQAAASQAIIAWILPENCRVKKCIEEVSLNVICQFRAIAPSIACSTFVERGIVFVLLRPSCIPGCANEIDRLKAVPQKQMKLFLRVQRAWLRVPVRMWRSDGLDFQFL